MKPVPKGRLGHVTINSVNCRRRTDLRDDFSRPCGTSTYIRSFPSTDVLGYFRAVPSGLNTDPCAVLTFSAACLSGGPGQSRYPGHWHSRFPTADAKSARQIMGRPEFTKRMGSLLISCDPVVLCFGQRRDREASLPQQRRVFKDRVLLDVGQRLGVGETALGSDPHQRLFRIR